MFRWFALAVLLASLTISTVRRSQARQDGGVVRRSQESGALIAGRLAVALPLFGGVFAYLMNPEWMAWAQFNVPSWVRWTGVALGVLVVPSVYWVLTTLGSNVSETVLTKADHQLVTTGPYRWVRHPLYATGIAMFLSIALMAANWFMLLWAVVAVAGLYLAVIPREEANLVAAFGDSYRQYRRRTGALLPRLTLRSPRREG